MRLFGIYLCLLLMHPVLVFAQPPIKDLPGITQITFHERTTNLYSHTYDIDDTEPNQQLFGQLNDGNRDFEGWPDKEFYDVFYSDANGNFDPNGAYATIEARFDMSTGGGGLNIAEVELHFNDGTSFYCQYVSSHFGMGPNYLPASPPLSHDCDLLTACTMGSTLGSNLRLRITLGVQFEPTFITEESCSGSGYEIEVEGTVFDEDNPSGYQSVDCDSLVYVDLTFYPVYDSLIVYEGCSGDGYSVTVDGTIYDESNPFGVKQLLTQFGCDSTVTVDLSFAPLDFEEINYSGCHDDGFSVTVNGTVYDESNPSGTELMSGSNGCDSTVSVALEFHALTFGAESYTGCTGDGYFVEVNGNIYNESNPDGIEVLSDVNGCDSTVTIALQYLEHAFGDELYSGCSGDGYSVEINGITYNEDNPEGLEILTAANGCDSVVTIELNFNEATNGIEEYTGCTGSGYFVIVGGNIYDENNPEGVEILLNENGCDSAVTIDLEYADEVYGEVFYEGCAGDGYSVLVNGTVYDQNNPDGIEILVSQEGCDSIVTISLSFDSVLSGDETYSGCSGDGYSVIINGTVYDESNPDGIETLISTNGCDSLVTVALQFSPQSTGNENYNGCTGDGYFVVANGNTYNESNPLGTETLLGANGCDSIVTIALQFASQQTTSIEYQGCSGDGYQVIVNGTAYNEGNPTGTENLTGNNGCDSVVTINMTFGSAIMLDHSYEGCVGDGYEVVINGVMYNEANPSGIETLSGVTECDTIVTILLEFAPSSAGEFEYTGCSGDNFSIVLNGTVYNENNPAGIETLINSAGCDSVVTIDLSFLPSVSGSVQYTGCSGDGYSVFVNGTVYNELNPQGAETLTGSNGCDSLVNIDLQFLTETSGSVQYSGCTGDGYSVIVNGTVYNESNPQGTETLTGSNSCDSIVSIALNFEEFLEGMEIYEGCSGDGYSVTVNGNTYNETTPTGTESLLASNGCDSIVYIELLFYPEAHSEIQYNGCSGDSYSVVVNSQVYNEQNPIGTEVLFAQNGCDSIVTIALQYAPTVSSIIEYQGCIGDGYSVTVNNTVYNEGSPVGSEVLTNVQGCDSTISVFLEFEPCEEDDCAFYVPNVFSANDDNINDAFRFYFSDECLITSFSIRIFDRWGALVFDSQDPAFEWNANEALKRPNAAVFVYVAEIFFEGEQDPVLKYGDVTLIR